MFINISLRNRTLRDHPLSMYAKFKEKITFLPTDTDTFVSSLIFLNHRKSSVFQSKFSSA